MITKDSRFCFVENGVIRKYNVRQKDTGLGINSPLETYTAKGCYPLLDNVPSIDTATQRIGGSSYSIDEVTKTVTKVYTVVDIPLEEIIAKKITDGEAYLKSTVNTELQKFNTKYGTIFEKVNDMGIYIMDTTYYLRTECDTLVKWNNLFYATARANQDAVLAGTMTDEEFIATLPLAPEV